MKLNFKKRLGLARAMRPILSIHHCGRGVVILVLTFLFIAMLTGVNFSTRSRVFVAGEVATCDVVAHRDMLVEDSQATLAQREKVLLMQPAVYDFSFAPYAQFHSRLMEIFQEANSLEPLRKDSALSRLMDELTPDVGEEVILQIARPELQQYIHQKMLPYIREKLNAGLVGDIRTARVSKSGAIIRDLETGEEILRTNISALPDVHGFLSETSTRLRADKDISPASRKAVLLLLSALIPPSLTLNQEMTRQRGAAVAERVDPVYHHLQKGEVVVRKGDKVSREEQIKLQAIYNTAGSRLQIKTVLGSFGVALLLAVGFFMAPSGKPGTPLRCKDLLLIALVLLVVSLGAKAVYFLGERTGDLNLMATLAYCYPVAGAVGLVAMVFAARRYGTMGLLLSFFCTLIFHGDVSLFLYYFLGGMLTTWLVTRAQNRQDVVWSILPLTVGQLVIWAMASILAQTNISDMPAQAVAVVGSSVISLLMLFAFSPVLELIFAYTTRFRLMELMNLEQPLMQEIMVTMPGTYHHSLVVANMVEAGAKAIGANSLLCKVAALYHDAGKLSHPEYFIENQFGGKNKHDRLAPSMSALILISHVKKGTELAETHGLGQEILDIIRQHHGTRIIRFFYQKALDLGETPRGSDYCYPGPRPQTKEAAILMLADAVEASSRTLNEPTPARIKSHIDTIVKGIFAEGQLDESELTFKDLHKLSENFLRILTGIFHQRIAYPDSTKPKAPGTLQASPQAPLKPEVVKNPGKPEPPKPSCPS